MLVKCRSLHWGQLTSDATVYLSVVEEVLYTHIQVNVSYAETQAPKSLLASQMQLPSKTVLNKGVAPSAGEMVKMLSWAGA